MERKQTQGAHAYSKSPKQEPYSRELPLSGVITSLDVICRGNNGCFQSPLSQSHDKLIFVIVLNTEADSVRGSWAPTGKSVLNPSFLIWETTETLWIEQTEYWLTGVARRDLWLRSVALRDATALKESVTSYRSCNTGEHFWKRRKQQSFGNSSWRQVVTPSAASTLTHLVLLLFNW